jgi:hypothetical protein
MEVLQMKATRGRLSLRCALLLVPGLGSWGQGIPNHPIEAERRVEVSHDGKNFRLVAEGKMFRDSVGRFRVEESLYGKAGRLVRRSILIETADGTQRIVSYELDPDGLSAFRHSQEIPMAPNSTDAPPTRWKVRAHQALGRRIIEGLECEGMRYGESPIATHYDVWRCEPLHVDVLRVYYLKDGTVERTSLTNIRQADLAPELFVVPKEYQVRNHNSKCKRCVVVASGRAGSDSTGKSATGSARKRE